MRGAAVEPTSENGLAKPSRVMVDKLYSLPNHRMHDAIGHLDEATMLNVGRAPMMLLALDELRTAGDSSPQDRDMP
ncbi:type II toxin-antitoxin system PemK/MazF family toxin [Jiella sp. CQZ9-1]|uniref:Type II toxin-antitoxin system PemK/MazF family toxin n=1 Tax=Jiella flava TaxID=2816857 RepID=A0A939FV32_9HYPH|nr:type II toxin-antitoxin system PemK/MazF family toxin [Jiella flava]MBO0662052.1 type II toxin-antitoxin system PemK/MazF family toxin [Jiella flava]